MPRKPTMKVVEVEVGKLKAAEYNPRQMTEKQVNDLTESIRRFGLVEPLVVNSHNGRSNVVVGGHQRLKIAISEGLAAVPVVYVDLNEKSERELNLRLNKNNGEWDWDALAEFDKDLLFDVGFDEKELNKYFQLDVVEDEVPEPRPDPNVKLGDLFQLGNHRLLCGDATRSEDVERLMDGQKADMVFTDPPYNMHYDGAGIIRETVKNVRERIKDMVDFDVSDISYLSQMGIPTAYIFTSKDLIPDYLRLFDGWRFNILVWAKTNSPPMTHNVFLPDVEYLLYFHTKERIWNNGLTPMDVYRKCFISGRDTAAKEHPTKKPIQLLSDKIRISSNHDGIVLDLFGGSGSTLIACEQLNRKCYMMEIDPQYVRVIIDRWEKLTGQKAIKL